jgi:hypothetical protein
MKRVRADITDFEISTKGGSLFMALPYDLYIHAVLQCLEDFHWDHPDGKRKRVLITLQDEKYRCLLRGFWRDKKRIMVDWDVVGWPWEKNNED